MDRAGQLVVFRAQTENVRGLDSAWKQLRIKINRDLVHDKAVSATDLTKSLALVFCAWSEANFSKLIHTPHGFELDEIKQIKSESSRDIVRGWEKCLDLGLSKVSSGRRSNYIPNIKQSVARIIQEYVHEPRLLRNKIAHGQWVVALNRANIAKNVELTTQVNAIDIVILSRWRDAYVGLSNIIESLIESPTRTFHRDYWIETTRLVERLDETASWTLASKVAKLKDKHARYSPRATQ
jgi:hypothetical protein